MNILVIAGVGFSALPAFCGVCIVKTERGRAMKSDERLVAGIVRQIVELAHPIRVLIFGSRARGSNRVGSDVDVLVVVPNGTPCRLLAQDLYAKIDGHGIPFDVVVTTPITLQKHKSNPGLVYCQALLEGKEVYAA